MGAKSTIPVEVEKAEMPRSLKGWWAGAVKVTLLTGGLLGGLWLLQMIAKN
jgi:hypothetical protein